MATISKRDLLDLVDPLPETVDVEDLIRRLRLLAGAAAAAAEAKAGRPVPPAKGRERTPKGRR